MGVYYDTGVLVALYVEEVFSSAVNAFVEDRGVPIAINHFTRLEFENAVRLKIFRGDIHTAGARRVLQDLEEDLESGRLCLRPLDWNEALARARSISARSAAQVGCRTLDVLHVAIAIQWKCGLFVSADARQLASAAREGLETVDVSRLERR